MKKIVAFILLFLIAIPMLAHNDSATIVRRPKVGVVMAGGGAKGSAHIGALKYIEEMGIPIDFVTGTSMGSIIGGLTALGYTSEQMRTIISGMDWTVYMSNNVARENMGYQAILDKERFLIKIPFGQGSIKEMLAAKTEYDKKNSDNRVSLLSTLPSGFIEGDKLLNLFNNLSVGYQDSIDFNELPVPFACITMNLVTGEPKIITSGNLAQAIRASMAIPGVFAPVYISNEELLVDGGLVNNFPVDVCRAMGADIVIGLEVNQDMKSEANDLKSLPNVLTQLLRYETGNGLKENRANCDIYIRPSTKGFGTMSFDVKSIDTLIARGYNEAAKYHDQFAEIKKRLDGVEINETARAKKAARYAVVDTIQIGSVQLTGLDSREAKKIIKPLEQLVGKRVLTKDIEKSIKRYYGLSCFKSVTYKLLGASEPYALVVNFEKSAPHHFGFGIRYDTDASAAILLSAGYNTQKLKGFSLDFTGRLSSSPYTKLVIGFNNGIYTKGNLAYTANFSKFPMNFGDTTRCQLTLHKYQVDLYLSDAYYKNQSFQIGLRYEKFKEKKILSVQGFFDKLNYYGGDFLSAFANYDFDNMNDSFFPTKGVRANVNAQYVPYIPLENENVYVAESSFGAIQCMVEGNVSLSKNVVLVPSLYVRNLINGLLVGPYANYVGGEQAGRHITQQMPFVGINTMSYVGDFAGILRADLRVRVLPKLYLSAIFNYMHYAWDVKDFFSKNYNYDVFGAGIKCSLNTFLGPVSLTMNWSNFNKYSQFGAYFSLGRYF